MKKIKYFVLEYISIIILVSFVIFQIKPELIVSSGITRSISNFSGIHGEGYQLQGNVFTITDENAYFICDLQRINMKCKAIDLIFSSDTDQKYKSKIYYSNNEYFDDDKYVEGELNYQDKIIRVKKDIENCKYLKIYINAEVGTNYTLMAIGLEQDRLSIGGFTLIFIIIISILLCMFLYIIKIDKIIINSIKYICKAIYNLKHKLETIGDKQIFLIKYIFIFGSQVLFLLFLLLKNNLVYVTNDDTTMISIASGGYGRPSEWVINMHVVAGYLLKLLYGITTKVNWMTIFFILVILISFFILDYLIICSSDKDMVKFIVLALVTDVCFEMMLIHFTFTVIAYSAAISGVCCLLYYVNNKGVSKKVIFIGTILIILSSLIRSDVLKSIIILLLVISIYKLFFNKDKKYILIEIAIFFILVFSIGTNRLFININSEQASFIQWGEARSKALDCKAITYDESLFNSVNISKAQYNAMYNQFDYIKRAVDIDVLNRLDSLNTDKYKFDLKEFCINHFEYLLFGKSAYSYEMYKWIFAILVMINLVCGSRRVKRETFLIWLGTICTEFIYFFIQRALYRVVMPTYVFAIMALIICIRGNIPKYDLEIENREKQKAGYVVSIGLLIMFIIVGKNVEPKNNTYLYSSSRKQVLDYLEENENKLFMAGDINVYSIGVCSSIWNNVTLNNKWNLIGNWEIYSVPSNTLIKKYGYNDCDNITYSAINSDNILLLTTEGDDFKEKNKYILDLYQQYYGISPKFEKVEDICENHINEYETEKWSVYRIVYE